MRASALSLAGISLLAMSMFAVDAAAMEQNGSVGGSSSAPGLDFPSFLDADRLPALQEAWRAKFGSAPTQVQAPALMQGNAQGVAHGDAMSAARAAMRRVGDATRQAPAVRQAAEEISRRFSGFAGGSASEGADGGVVVSTAIGDAPSADAARQDAKEAAAVAAGEGAGAVPETGGAVPVRATAAIPEAEMRPQSARLEEIPQARTFPKLVKIPPLPPRASEATTSHNGTKRAPTRKASASAPTKMVTVERPPVQPETAGRREVFPHYMRAFGWDDQP